MADIPITAPVNGKVGQINIGIPGAYTARTASGPIPVIKVPLYEYTPGEQVVLKKAAGIVLAKTDGLVPSESEAALQDELEISIVREEERLARIAKEEARLAELEEEAEDQTV